MNKRPVYTNKSTENLVYYVGQTTKSLTWNMYKIICKVSRKILPKIIASSTEQVAILITKEYKKMYICFYIY